MRHPCARLFTALGCLASAQLSTAAGQTTADDQAIRQVIQAHAAAWNRRDATAAAAAYTPDAVIRTSSGRLIAGRAAIEQAHHEWLAQDTVGGGSTHLHPPETIKIQFLGPDIAVADLDGCFQEPPRANGTRPARECTPLFIVLTKRAGAWHVAEQRALPSLRS